MNRRRVLQILTAAGAYAPGLSSIRSLLLLKPRPLAADPKLKAAQSSGGGVLSLQIACDDRLQKKYKCERSKVLYEGLWDDDHDGEFDGVNTSGWQNLLSKVPADYSGLVALDWENAAHRQGFIRTPGSKYQAVHLHLQHLGLQG